MLGLWLNITTHRMILLPYRFCGDNHHAFAFPFVLIFLPLRLSMDAACDQKRKNRSHDRPQKTSLFQSMNMFSNQSSQPQGCSHDHADQRKKAHGIFHSIFGPVHLGHGDTGIHGAGNNKASEKIHFLVSFL